MATPSPDARLALPLDAEGEYRWGEPGEVIELYLENGALRGYLTRRSDRRDAGSAPMTFTFAHAEAAAGTLSFTTRRVHGDWYSFTGKVVRGAVASLHQDGYYLLQGTLSMHLGASGPDDKAVGDSDRTRKSSAETLISRQVSLKSQSR